MKIIYSLLLKWHWWHMGRGALLYSLQKQRYHADKWWHYYKVLQDIAVKEGKE